MGKMMYRNSNRNIPLSIRRKHDKVNSPETTIDG